MPATMKPNSFNTRTIAALDVCGTVLRKALGQTDESTQGDDAAVRVAHIADALNRCRLCYASIDETVDLVLAHEPKEYYGGNPSGAAVKNACVAIVCILESINA